MFKNKVWMKEEKVNSKLKILDEKEQQRMNSDISGGGHKEGWWNSMFPPVYSLKLWQIYNGDIILIENISEKHYDKYCLGVVMWTESAKDSNSRSQNSRRSGMADSDACAVDKDHRHVRSSFSTWETQADKTVWLFVSNLLWSKHLQD